MAVPEIRWDRLPLSRALPPARDWLLHAASAGLSPTTLDAYSRAVERYLAWCQERRIRPSVATTEHLTTYLHELVSAGLRDATLLQRLTAIRLFYAHVVAQGIRPDNPARQAGSGSIIPPSDASHSASPLVPWVPAEGEWLAILVATRAEHPRAQLMLALAYEGALRREELCGLRRAHLDLDQRVLRVPAIGAGQRRTRVVPLSLVVVEQCARYLGTQTRSAGHEDALFLSESPRNYAEPISIWTWSKIVARIADRAGLPRLTTHTPRHLRLTDLARSGHRAAEIARFAGQSRPNLAHPYLVLADAQPGPPDQALDEARHEQFARVLFHAQT